MLKELEKGKSTKILVLIYTIRSLTSILCIFGMFLIQKQFNFEESIKLYMGVSYLFPMI